MRNASCGKYGMTAIAITANMMTATAKAAAPARILLK